MDPVEIIEGRIEYFKSLILNWDLDGNTKKLYETQIDNLEAKKESLQHYDYK